MSAAYCARSNICRAPGRRSISPWSIPLVVACLLAWEGLGAPAAHAVDRCVDPANPSACFSTIQAAVDAAASGDTITVAAGTYAEHVDTGSKVLAITGAGAANTVVDGSNSGRVFYATADLALADLTVQNGDAGAEDSGGGIAAENALILTNVQVLSNTAGLDGGGAAVGGAAIINDSVFSANHCTGPDCGGGGLFAGESLTLTGAQFLTNTAQVGGGGAATNGTAILNGGLLQGNQCTASQCVGGGILVSDTLTLSDTQFLSNSATSSGGGAATTGASILYGGLFQGNHCTADYCQGGGLITAGSLTLTGTHFLTNTAFLGGGAVAVGAATLNGGLFQGNTLTSEICDEGQCPAGGGLYAQATLALTDTQFLSNAAGLGGGAFADKAATLNSGLFQGNTALIYCEEDDSLCGGGGLYARNTLTLTGTQFLTNAGAIGGGAVVVMAASLNGGFFQGNTTSNECETDPCGGGGLYAMGDLALADTRFVGNSAMMGGGATVAGSAILNGGLFYSNRTHSDGSLGGGIFTVGQLVITATQFISNTANDGGGAASTESAAIVQGGLFASNTCTYSECGGGGLNADDMTLSDTIFISNTAAAGGGGAVSAGQATVTRSLFQSNACTSFPGFGGGLYAASGATLIETQFISNTAFALGGGAHIEGTATLTGNQFRGNSSGTAGGGAGIAGPATLNGDVFQENSSSMSGGGLHRESAVVDDESDALAGMQGAVDGVVLNGVQFISNTAQMGGGASVEGPATLTGNQFRWNNSSSTGGGVAIFGLATLSGDLFQENSSGSLGGGLYMEPADVGPASQGSAGLLGAVNSAALNGVQFISNTAQAGGGGAVISTTAALDSALFQNNTCAQAACRGGGLLSVQGPLSVSATLFLGNQAAGTGGGLAIDAPAIISNSTFAANSAATGGGLHNTGALTLTNNTLAANSATTGGGLHNHVGGQLWLRNTLIAGSSGGDCTGTGAIVQNANNLVQDGSCAAALSGNPILAPLDNYGGGTKTLALLPGSPAIDAADGALCPVTDQRGVARSPGACDIGAFESSGFQVAVTGGSPQTTTVNTAFAAPLQAVVSAAPGEPAGPGGVLTLTPPPAGAGIGIATPFTLTTDVGGAAAVAVTANTVAGSYEVTATARGVLTPAVFALTNTPPLLTVVKAGDGRGSVTSEPPLIDCGLTCTAALNYGTQVTLTATAAPGSSFTGWTGGCTGSGPCSLTMAADQVVVTATFQAAPAPLAVNDAASALDTQPVTVAVTANDRDYAGSGLTVTGVGAPLHGVASVAPGEQAVSYTAQAGYTGLDSFSYTVTDINGRTASALVTIVIASDASGQAQPQVQPVDPQAGATAIFTATGASLNMQAPGGFFTGTVGMTDTFFLAFTPVITATEQTNQPPANFKFGNLEFNLTAFLNDQPQTGLQFAQPVTLTIRYDSATPGELNPETLGLWYWNGSQWSTEGIAIVARNVAEHTITVTIGHLSQFAFFAQPFPPAATYWLHLPSLSK